jgi:hypothetical protein
MAEIAVPNLASRPGAPVYRATENLGETPRVDTRAVVVPRLQNSFGAAVARLGQALGDFSEKLDRAGHATAALNARGKMLAGMNDLVARYRADPDPATAPGRFAKDLDEMQQQAVSAIADPVLREKTAAETTVQGLQAYRQLQNFSLARQRQDGIAGLKARRAAYLKNATNAGSPVEREAVTASYEDEVDTLKGAGLLHPAEAQAAKQRFGSDLASGDAQTAIAHDPDAAAHALEDPQSFPGLAPPQRAALQIDAANAGDAAAWRQQDAADIAAMRALGAGTLTQADLDAAAPHMSATAYREISAALNRQSGGNFDAKEYGSLLSGAADGDDVRLDAVRALGAGRIDRAAFANVMRTVDQTGGDIDAAPAPQGPNDDGSAGLWRVDQRQQLYQLLAPQPGQTQGAARAQLDDGGAFDQWLAANPNASPADGQAQMQQVAAQARANAAAIDRQSLPLPAGVSAARGEIDGDKLGAAAARVRDAFDAGTMDPGTLSEQTSLLSAWQSVVNGSAAK